MDFNAMEFLTMSRSTDDVEAMPMPDDEAASLARVQAIEQINATPPKSERIKAKLQQWKNKSLERGRSLSSMATNAGRNATNAGKFVAKAAKENTTKVVKKIRSAAAAAAHPAAVHEEKGRLHENSTDKFEKNIKVWEVQNSTTQGLQIEHQELEPPANPPSPPPPCIPESIQPKRQLSTVSYLTRNTAVTGSVSIAELKENLKRAAAMACNEGNVLVLIPNETTTLSVKKKGLQGILRRKVYDGSFSVALVKSITLTEELRTVEGAAVNISGLSTETLRSLSPPTALRQMSQASNYAGCMAMQSLPPYNNRSYNETKEDDVCMTAERANDACRGMTFDLASYKEHLKKRRTRHDKKDFSLVKEFEDLLLDMTYMCRYSCESAGDCSPLTALEILSGPDVRRRRSSSNNQTLKKVRSDLTGVTGGWTVDNSTLATPPQTSDTKSVAGNNSSNNINSAAKSSPHSDAGSVKEEQKSAEAA